ncbi:MAG TPA: hypothetical protein VF043_35885 [Ktedonobacteraceae bacterium]
MTKRRHYNLVFLHARRKAFPAFADMAEAVQEVWPGTRQCEPSGSSPPQSCLCCAMIH